MTQTKMSPWMKNRITQIKKCLDKGEFKDATNMLEVMSRLDLTYSPDDPSLNTWIVQELPIVGRKLQSIQIFTFQQVEGRELDIQAILDYRQFQELMKLYNAIRKHR